MQNFYEYRRNSTPLSAHNVNIFSPLSDPMFHGMNFFKKNSIWIKIKTENFSGIENVL